MSATEKKRERVDAFESIGPGKFDNRADRRAYRVSLDGGDEIANSGRRGGARLPSAAVVCLGSHRQGSLFMKTRRVS